jgi:hypothetical protein
MLSDEIRAARALEIAIHAVSDSLRMHNILQARLTNRILQYQYQALLTDLQQREHTLLHLKNIFGESTDQPVRSQLGGKFPDEGRLSSIPLPELLEFIAAQHDEVMATFADMASRVEEPEIKAVLHDLSEISFAHKSKALTDLQLMKQHRDYH